MTDLNEKWKKGELPEGWYYSQEKHGVEICHWDSDHGMWDTIFGSEQVLAKVPTYQEYQALLSDSLAKNEGVEINAELEATIKKREIKIKELYETIDIFADINLDLIKNIETLVQTLLKVSPEHREWLETNFKEYL